MSGCAVLAWAVVAVWVAWLGLHAGLLAWGGIQRVVGWYFVIGLLPLTAAPVLLPAVGVVAWRRRVSVPAGLLIGSSGLALLPGLVGFGLVPMAYPFASLESATPAASVRLPTDAEMVVVWGGDALRTNYHAADPAQRWAVDLVIEPAGHGAPANADYGCYGVDVLAPASGRVAVAVDGHPDGDPANFAPNFEAPAGNHVALELDSGTYLVVAHLMPGSVAVAVGDVVQEGDRLGRCGNSGNSSEPHVHLHHQRQDPAVLGLMAEGLPLYFRGLRDRPGDVMPIGGVAIEEGRVRFVGDVVEPDAGVGARDVADR